MKGKRIPGMDRPQGCHQLLPGEEAEACPCRSSAGGETAVDLSVEREPREESVSHQDKMKNVWKAST